MVGGATRAKIGAAIGVLVLAQLSIGAQQPPTFRSMTELVNLNVTVLGADSAPVEGLSRAEFEVFEDGVPQELKFFAAGELPLDVAVLLDTSASMSGAMPLIQTAASRLIAALRPHDRAMVLGISGGLRVLEPMTEDKSALLKAIRTSKAGGRTPLYASIYTTLRELEKVQEHYGEPRRQAIVVLSDGQDTASGFGFDVLLDSVRRHAVPIYTIAPRPSEVIKAQREIAFGETTHEQDYELRKLATETGARAYFPVHLNQLAGVYDDIATELAHQYSIGYQSTNDGPGGYRRIALRVNVPGVTWRSRTGYIAESSRTVGNGDLQ